MPKINQINSTIESTGQLNTRVAKGEDFGGDIGTGLAQVGKGVTDVAETYQKVQEQSDVSNISAALAANYQKHTQYLNDSLNSADPNDPKIVENLSKSFDENIQGLEENVKTGYGKKYLQSQAQAQKAHFIEQGIRAEANIAGTKAVNDYYSTLNSYSSALVTNPGAYDFTKDQVSAYITNSNLSAEQKLELQQKADTALAVSTVKGWMNVNPEYAKEQLEKGRWDNGVLNGDQKAQLMGETDRAIRGKELEVERQKQKQDEIKRTQQVATQNDFLTKLQTNELTSKDILNSNLDAFGSGSKDTFLRMLETKLDKPIKTDQDTFLSLYQRITLPDGDPKKIVDENDLNPYLLGKKISFEDLGKLRGAIQGRRTTEGEIENTLKKTLTDTAKHTLSKSNDILGIRDPQGDENYLSYLNWFLKEYQDQKKKGKSANELLDPKSPDYLGKTIPQYGRNTQQIYQSLTPSAPLPGNSNAAPNPETARKPGESILEWRKRTGR